MNHDPSCQLEPEILARSRPLIQPLYSTANSIAALTSLLTLVCAKTTWEYGESWIPNPTYPILELSPAWCINRALSTHRVILWMQFQVFSKAFVLRSGEGMPGRIWQSQHPEWIEDVSAQSETYFLRNQIAKALSVKAGFGVPIIASERVLAVVVFFMSKARSPDAPLMKQTQAIVRNFQYEFSTRI